MKKGTKILQGLASLLFSFGSGFVFFALNYEYRQFDITGSFNKVFIIVVSFVVGFFFISGGVYTLGIISGRNESINSITKKDVRQIVREEIKAALAESNHNSPASSKVTDKGRHK
jgi:hypothetical protein